MGSLLFWLKRSDNIQLNILLVSHYFVPYSGVGSKRMSYLARYLIRKKETVFVIKAADEYYGDNICSDRIDGASSFDVRLTTSIKNLLLNAVLWRRSYKQKIEELLRIKKVDVIVFSGGPFFYFGLGRYFLKKYGINYVLDYRDPYIDNEMSSLSVVNKLKKAIIDTLKRIIEADSLKHAKFVVNVTQELSDMMLREYKIDSKKLRTIMNGYDDDIVKNLNVSGKTPFAQDLKGAKLVLGIFGKFAYYSKEHPKMLFGSLNVLKIKNEINVELMHIGEKEEEMFTSAKTTSVSDRYLYLGKMEYKQAMQELSSADVLVMNNRSVNALGTKIFDYIYLNKPIIALISRTSAIASFLSRFDHAYVCETQEELEKAIKHIYTEKLFNLDKQDFDPMAYSRSKQMDAFYSIIKEVKC